MKDLNFKHFIDDSQKCAEFAGKFMSELEKLKKKRGYLILENDTGVGIIQSTEINAIYISEQAPEIISKDETIG
jgi:hypothetical protein